MDNVNNKFSLLIDGEEKPIVNLDGFEVVDKDELNLRNAYNGLIRKFLCEGVDNR